MSSFAVFGRGASEVRRTLDQRLESDLSVVTRHTTLRPSGEGVASDELLIYDGGRVNLRIHGFVDQIGHFAQAAYDQSYASLGGPITLGFTGSSTGAWMTGAFTYTCSCRGSIAVLCSDDVPCLHMPMTGELDTWGTIASDLDPTIRKCNSVFSVEAMDVYPYRDGKVAVLSGTYVRFTTAALDPADYFGFSPTAINGSVVGL